MFLKTASIYLTLLVASVFSDLTIHPDDNSKMSFKPPVLSEEEMRSWAIPDQLKCDSCLAVAYQIHLAFTAAHKPWAENQHFRLSEPEVLDIGEKICSPKIFEVYGISMENTIKIKKAPYNQNDDKRQAPDPNEDKVHRLKGPGVWDEPGAAHMGGKTPLRLSELCTQYMENLEEFRIYVHWVQSGKTEVGLQHFLCRNPNKEEDGLDLNLCNFAQKKMQKLPTTGPKPKNKKDEL